MDIDVWHFWLVGAVVFMILEIFIPSFFCACISIGCIGGAIASVVGGCASVQLFLFSILTIIAFFGIRPLIKRYFYQKEDVLCTNTDRLIGHLARVSERIDIGKNTGRVLVDGDDWKAVSEDNAILEEGTMVRIIAIESVVLIVKKQ
ncbi:MAG: NfeD family protein [Bacteroidales bacterium]